MSSLSILWKLITNPQLLQYVGLIKTIYGISEKILAGKVFQHGMLDPNDATTMNLMDMVYVRLPLAFTITASRQEILQVVTDLLKCIYLAKETYADFQKLWVK